MRCHESNPEEYRRGFAVGYNHGWIRGASITSTFWIVTGIVLFCAMALCGMVQR